MNNEEPKKIDEIQIDLNEEQTEALKEILSGKVKPRKISNEEYTYNLFNPSNIDDLK